MIKVQVDRKRWYRGKGGAGSALLVASPNVAFDAASEEDFDKMCCLGFVALELGFTEDEIRGVRTPRGLPGTHSFPGVEELVTEKESPLSEAMRANDDPLCSDLERECRIAAELDRLNIRISFHN